VQLIAWESAGRQAVQAMRHWNPSSASTSSACADNFPHAGHGRKSAMTTLDQRERSTFFIIGAMK